MTQLTLTLLTHQQCFMNSLLVNYKDVYLEQRVGGDNTNNGENFKCKKEVTETETETVNSGN
jgi:hypothetical protein